MDETVLIEISNATAYFKYNFLSGFPGMPWINRLLKFGVKLGLEITTAEQYCLSCMRVHTTLSGCRAPLIIDQQYIRWTLFKPRVSDTVDLIWYGGAH
jgi:hypothetical protein